MNTPVEALPSDETRPYVLGRALRRRWPLVLLPALVLAAAVGAFVLTQPVQYTATAKVLLQPLPGNPLSPDVSSRQRLGIAMETEAGLVESADVAALAGKRLHQANAPDPAAVRATVPPSTQVVQVEYAARSPRAARDGAQAFADAFLAYRHERAVATQQRRLDALDEQVHDTRKSLKHATADAAEPDAPPYAEQQVQLYANRLATLRDVLSQAESQGTDAGSVVTPAELPTAPADRHRALFLAGAVLVGLAVGLAVAVAREREDDRVRAAVETVVGGVPVLARLSEASAERHEGDPAHEAYRSLRAAVMLALPRPCVVAVAALTATEPPPRGTAEVTVELGRTLARAGYPVTLVDASAGGDLPALLGAPKAPGVTDVLTGRSRVADAAYRVGDLRLIPTGSDRAAARALLASEPFAGLVTGLSADADYVVVAAPPVATPDGIGVVQAAHGVALLVEDGRTTHTQVAEAATRLGRLDVAVLGVVVHPRRSRRLNSGGVPRGKPVPAAPTAR